MLLSACVRARLSVIVSGGTGTGKTTLLNALSAFVPDRERIVTVEDSAELSLKQEHVVRLESRPANVEGSGASHHPRPRPQHVEDAAGPDRGR